ncbi:MAG TPA: zinc-dependent metalloprotease, partial [Saprospiraceae bacterium]|nr:zinc-dependent metalloprotease [Saprospiraceae bacterium]
VVIDFRAFGKGSFTVPGVGSLPIEGRTTVHEVGHYLGLRHISGDGFSGLLGIPDCDADDGLADTPNQGFQSQFDCNAAQNTCDEGAGDLPDMIENYMDYSRETCQNTFTKGQVNIMRNVLEGPRRGLLETSSVETPQFEQFIEISPNPSTALFYIKTPADMAVKNLRISDALGRQIEQVSNPATNFIDLSAQPRGVYWLSFYFENGKMSSRKLLKF